MKKILRAGAIILAVVLMAGVGVYAILNNSVDFNIGSNVSFTTGVGVRLDISAALADGNVEDEDVREYSGATYSADSEASVDAGPWTIGDIDFVVVSGKAVITYTFTFTNAGAEDTVVEITKPTITESRLLLAGGLSDGEEEPTYSGDSGTVVAGESITFVYTLTLSDFSQNLTSTSISFAVEMALVSDQD